MLRRVVAKVHEVCETVGFGSVTIVIEKGRPRWIEAGTRTVGARRVRRRVGSGSELQM